MEFSFEFRVWRPETEIVVRYTYRVRQGDDEVIRSPDYCTTPVLISVVLRDATNRQILPHIDIPNSLLSPVEKEIYLCCWWFIILILARSPECHESECFSPDLPLVTSDQFSSREIAPFNNGHRPQSDKTESSGTLLSLDMFLFWFHFILMKPRDW